MSHKNIDFLKEKYEKERKAMKFREEFTALPGMKPISGKFYAKHDVPTRNEALPEYLEIVKRDVSSTPKDFYEFPPPCVNMNYGWYAKTLIPRTSDKRLTFPLRQCDYVKTEIYIKAMDGKTRKRNSTA